MLVQGRQSCAAELSALHQPRAGLAPDGTHQIPSNALIGLVFVHCIITWHD
jgi:hypothetical protein